MENINNTLMDGDLHEKFPNRDEAKKAEINHFETVIKSFLHYEEHGASALLYLLLSHAGVCPAEQNVSLAEQIVSDAIFHIKSKGFDC